jgi:5'-nucleotidase
MRVLVTNDDGVRACGLAVLARALGDAGHDVLVAAPLDEASGAGAGVGPLHTFREGIHVEKVEVPGLEGVETLGVEALPALIVIAASFGAFGKAPDLVVSGINPGRNIGRSVLHSGTVGAALTAAHFGLRGLAVSVQSAGAVEGPGVTHYSTAATLATALAPGVAAAPQRTVLNCNVPNVPLERLRGLRPAHLAVSGLIRTALVDEGGAHVQLDLGFVEPPPDDESDEALTAAGYATLTPLQGVTEDERPEVRDLVDSLLLAWDVASTDDTAAVL